MSKTQMGTQSKWGLRFTVRNTSVHRDGQLQRSAGAQRLCKLKVFLRAVNEASWGKMSPNVIWVGSWTTSEVLQVYGKGAPAHSHQEKSSHLCVLLFLLGRWWQAVHMPCPLSAHFTSSQWQHPLGKGRMVMTTTEREMAVAPHSHGDALRATG